MTTTLRLFTALALSASPLVAQNADLDRAKTLLAGRAEAEVNEGADLCAKADNVPAVELLLEVMNQTQRRSHLHLSPGHYRDICWDRLVKIKDIYARRRVEHELKTSKDPRVRQWCAELLGIYGDTSWIDSLEKALKDKDDDVVRWAARSLGLIGDASATKALEPRSRDKNDYVRANAIEALARCDKQTFVQPYVAAIANDKSGGVRCALLGAAHELVPDQVEALATTALQDPDWRPRMQAVRQLGKIRTKTAVDALLKALDDGRPVVAARAIVELQELTGQAIDQPAVWKQWWADNRESFAFPEGRGKPATKGTTAVSYNNLPVDSDHAAFLLDKSVMMGARLESKGMSKEDAAHQELTRVLDLLDEKITFNVFNYHVEIEAFEKKPVTLNKRTAKKALHFAAAPAKGREKDIWNALATVVPDQSLDTVYLLSSGEPDTGLYVHYNRVTRHLADLNRFHMVTVHCVAYTDSTWFRDQIQKIAEATGGSFEWLK
jgi:hypothetical protein